MRYRVAFSKRIQSDGDDSTMRPSAELDLNLNEGVVAEKSFVEQLESDAQHSQEVLDEDDAFLASATAEVWDYDVVDARCAEFEDALQNSDLVLEYEVVDDTATDAVDASTDSVDPGSVYPSYGGSETTEGSGLRAGDDGPAGMPTVDPTAGGLNVNPVPESGGTEDLQIKSADDATLGLTNRGRKGPQDWAANTGPTRNPSRSGP
jgi:hypothetical protein